LIAKSIFASQSRLDGCCQEFLGDVTLAPIDKSSTIPLLTPMYGGGFEGLS
jgi:hypothetical protein